MKMEAETGVTQPQAEEARICWEPPEAGKGKEGFSPEPVEEAWPCQHLGFGLLVSRIVREYISIVSSCYVFDTLLLWPQKINMKLYEEGMRKPILSHVTNRVN